MSWISTGLFLLAGTFIAYVLFGYPLLLAFMSSRRRNPVHRAFKARTVSILLPVWNGEQWIEAKLKSIAELDYPAELIETIVISDGSTDDTEELVRECAAAARLIAIPKSGKAVAINAGLKQATGEILLFTDVRQQLHPNSLRRLIECFADPTVGVASGELVILKGERREEANVGLYWRYEKWIRERLSRIDSVIGATGAIYAMRRELAVPLPPDTLLDDVFLPLAAFFRGYRVILDRHAWAFDYPTSLDSEFRRKVRTLAGNYQLLKFYPQLLGPRNRMWLHYMSHKFARLMLPFGTILLFVSSFGLPPYWRAAALLSQCSFYGLGILNTIIPETWLLKRLSSLIYTFLALQTAAVCALVQFLSGTRGIWKQTRVEAVVPHDPPALR